MSKVEIYTVSKITQLIKEKLEDNFDNLWIEGEVSNLRAPSSGHLYFTLKDESAQIQVVLFRAQKSNIKFQIDDGLLVIVNGDITVYQTRGIYQLVVHYIEPKGIGALQLAFEQLKKKLSEEGLFDEKFKKKIPLLPKKIGIVTSPTGAAIRDILKIIKRRFANVHIIIYPVKVQGEEAPQEISEGILELNRINDIDVIIVGRGGGSIEDLWAFNDEGVARRIFNSKIPIISAVGHEIDYTISDLTADLRAPTPSAAAELVVSNKEDIKARISQYRKDLLNIFDNKIQLIRRSLKLLTDLCNAYNPINSVRNSNQRLDEIMWRLQKVLQNSFSEKRGSTSNLFLKMLSRRPINELRVYRELLLRNRERMKNAFTIILKDLIQILGEKDVYLKLLNPLSQLERGYSICRKPKTNSVVNKISQIQKGEGLNVRIRDGEIICHIEELNKAS